MRDFVENLGLTNLQKLPMPSLNGRDIIEPSEFELAQIIAYARRGELYKAPQNLADWICYRLMPSLVRYGSYPPPHEKQAANN